MMRRLQPWIPVLLWGAVIFTFSTGIFTSVHTASVLTPVFHWLFPHANRSQLLFLNFLTRKSAHLFEYFVFGCLLLLAVRSPEHGWKFRWALLALLIAAGYSATDEFHQMFVPGRDASPWDSLLDTIGAAIALTTAWFVVRYHRVANETRHPRTS